MRKERGPTKGHFNMTFLRQSLVNRYGWTYEEINAMSVHDAEVAALLGRHGRSRDRRLIEDTINSVFRRMKP